MDKPRNDPKHGNDSPPHAGGAVGGLRVVGIGAAGNLIGFGLFTLSQWGVLSLLARMTGPEMVGLYSLGLAIVVPVFLLSSLSLRPAFATDHTGFWSIGAYIKLRLLGSVGGAVIAMAVAVFLAQGNPAVSVGLFGGLMAVMVVAKWAEAGSDLANAIFQAGDRMALVGRSLGLRGVLGVGLFGGLAYILYARGESATQLVLVGALGLTMGWLAVFWLVDRPAARTILHDQLAGRRNGAGSMTSLFLAVAPLATAIFITSVQVNLPRFVVERGFGLAELGLFAAIMAFYGVGTQAVNTAGQALMTRLAYNFREGHVRRQLLLLAALLVFAAGGGLALWGLAHFVGGELLALVYGDQFAAGAALFEAVAVVALVRFVAEALRIMLVASRMFWLRLGFEVLALGLLIVFVSQGIGGQTVMEVPQAMLRAELVSIALLLVIVVILLVRSASSSKKSRSGAAL